MKLNKYSASRSGGTVGSYADQRQSSSSGASASNTSGINRTIWGQQDYGQDIEGDITVDSLYLDIGGVSTNLLDILMPVGSVIMFNGASAIPANWAVCDGTNGTPNLTGKFIKGVKDKADVGKTGGASSVTMDNIIPAHTHKFFNYLTQVHGNDEIYQGDITIGGRELSVGKHQASRDPTRRADTSDSSYSDIPYILNETESTGSASTDNKTEVNIEPPFFSLIYIMRIR